MSESRQPTLSALANDEPEIGVSLDVRASFAHVRYAASESPGVIWYDPRDGHERLALDVDVELEDVEDGSRVLTGVTLHAKRARCQIVDPRQEWVVKRSFAVLEEFGDAMNDVVNRRVGNVRDSRCFEDVYSAREWCRESVPGYAAAEYRDAVAARVEDGGSS